MVKVEIALPLGERAMITHHPELRNTRVTLPSGDQYTLNELLGSSVELYLVNSDIVEERRNDRKDSRP